METSTVRKPFIQYSTSDVEAAYEKVLVYVKCSVWMKSSSCLDVAQLKKSARTSEGYLGNFESWIHKERHTIAGAYV